MKLGKKHLLGGWYNLESVILTMQISKETVINVAMEVLNEKVKELERILNNLSQDIAAESKSSAGDKHETSRAMIHLEQEKVGRQLSEMSSMQAKLKTLSEKSISDTSISEGNLVKTDKGWFYISVPLGKINVQGQEVFVISANSPAGKSFIGKKFADFVELNKVCYKIEGIL